MTVPEPSVIVAGERVDDPAEALRSLMAADRWAEVGRLLVRHDERIIASGHVDDVLAAAEKLCVDGPADSRLLLVWGYALQQRGDWLGALHTYRLAIGTDTVAPCLAFRMGQLYDLTGQPDLAVELFRRTEFGAPTLDEARLLFLAVRWFSERGDREEAGRLADRCAERAQRCGGHAAQAWSHRAHGLLSIHDGDRAAGQLRYGQALDQARRADDRVLALTVRAEHLTYTVAESDPATALAEIEEVLRLCRQGGRVGYESHLLSARAFVKARLGRLSEALADARQGHASPTGCGAVREVVFGLFALGDVHRRRGELGQAQAVLDEAWYLAADSYVPLRAPVLAALARVHAADDLVTARSLAEQAVGEAAEHEPWRATALLARGWVALLAGDVEQARADAAAARALAGRRRDRACLADAFQLAASSAADDRTSAALIGEAVTLWRVIGDEVGEASAVIAAARLGGSDEGVARAAAVLDEHGVPLDAGMADVLGAGVRREARLAVRTLGGFQVLRDGVPVPNTEWQSRKARDLLKILAAWRGRPVPRSRLVDLLWPDDLSARTGNRLSVLLSTVRTVLAPGGQPAESEPVVADRDSVSLDLSVVDVDVARFLAAAADARVAQRRGDRRAVDLLIEAEERYLGEFLPEDPDEEWATGVREEARGTYAAVLRSLVQLVPDPDQRIGYLMHLLEQDHYDEGAHLQLVRILREAGRYGEANRRHHAYLERMREIGVTPRAEVPAPTRH